MAKSLTETAKAILESAGSESLKPKSGGAMPPETLGTPTKAAEAPKKPGEGSNVGQSAAAPVSKDNSKPTKGADAPMPTKKLENVQEEEEVDEDIGISEELAAFIEGLVAEGKTDEEIVAAIQENFELVSEEDEEETVSEEETEEAAEEIQEEAKEEIKVDMTEHVNALLEGESLSEEFKAKATTIFEAAVKTKLDEEVKKLEEQYAVALEENVNSLMEELTASVDDYLNYVVEQWLSENEIAIESGLRTELTEDFISGLRQLFAENYIDIPEEKINVIEEMGAKVEELEAKLNEEIERNVELNKVLNESKKEVIVSTVVEGLTSAQAEKLKELVESVEFTNEAEFTEKVKTLRENYFPTTGVKTQQELDSVEAGTEGSQMVSEEMTGRMAQYTKVLGRRLPN